MTSFSVETVDGIGNTGRYPSIAVEGTDTIHIGYMDWTNGMLKYALRESGSSWSTEEVDNVGTVNLIDTSLGVDSNSKVHISHYSQSDGIYYSTNVGGGWQQTFVGDMGSSRLAVDNQDNIHLGLTNNKDDTITISYATNKSGGWVTTTIATWDAALEGGACAIAVAGSNEVHMVYCDGTSLTYSQISDGGASSEEAQSVNEVRYNPGMALDSNNKPHLVYFDDGYIKYTNRVSDDWLIPANIFTPEDGGMAPAMAIDSNDKIHVCFSTAGDAGGGTDIKYATNREGDWGYATVATMVTGEGLDFSNPDLLPSIAVDSNNQAHISFYDLDNQDLKYAVEE